MSGLPGATDIGEYLVSARSFEEYRAMFALTDGDLRRRMLDCPGGGASFAATAQAHGTAVVAVDPVYGSPPQQLVERLAAELTRGAAWTAANAERYVWDVHGDPEGHARLRAASATVFGRHLLARPDARPQISASPSRHCCWALTPQRRCGRQISR